MLELTYIGFFVLKYHQRGRYDFICKGGPYVSLRNQNQKEISKLASNISKFETQFKIRNKFQNQKQISKLQTRFKIENTFQDYENTFENPKQIWKLSKYNQPSILAVQRQGRIPSQIWLLINLSLYWIMFCMGNFT